MAFALANRIAKGQEKKKSILSRADDGFVVITSQFVVFGDSQVLSVEEALEKKLFGVKYNKKGVEVDPSVVSVIIKVALFVSRRCFLILFLAGSSAARRRRSSPPLHAVAAAGRRL